MDTIEVVRATRTVNEAAAIFGVDSKGIRKWIDQGGLRAERIGGRIVIPLSAINEKLNGVAA